MQEPLSKRARRRITRRLIPFLFIVYIICFLDRVNVTYANLEMTRDLNFTSETYGFGAGIFFIGYFVLEIPGTMLVERWSARGWIARIMISWGVLATCMGFIHTAGQFYAVRFLLGAAEAGFFPGIIVYLSHWFRDEDRAKAVALFMAAVPIANIVGSPISGLLLGVNWLGLAGWRWLFIVEGGPAIIFGVVTIFYLTDRPSQAAWLSEDEREWLVEELRIERQRKSEARSLTVLESLRHRGVIVLAVAYFFIITSSLGLNLWLPTIVKSISGLTNFQVTLVSALPYCFGLIAMIGLGWSSDRTKERRWHTVAPMLVAFVGLVLSTLVSSNPFLAIAMFCVAAAGLFSYFPSFWALPTGFLSGSAAAASIGLINSVGNLGGFVGPFVVGFVKEATKSFTGGVLYLAGSALVAAVLVLMLRKEDCVLTEG